MDIQPLGDTAIRICFGEGINELNHQQVRRVTSMLHAANIHGINEWVPAYNSVAIYYRPEIINYDQLIEAVERLITVQLRLARFNQLSMRCLFIMEEKRVKSFPLLHSIIRSVRMKLYL
ncbi:carboxyltransferase domain-containing protein, partial [Neobacillus drentensis]